MGCTGSTLLHNPKVAAIVPLIEPKAPLTATWTVSDHHVLSPVTSDTSPAIEGKPVMPENTRQDSVDPLRNAIGAMGGWGEESQLESPKHHKYKTTI